MPAPPWVCWKITDIIKAGTDMAGLGFEQAVQGFVTDTMCFV